MFLTLNNFLICFDLNLIFDNHIGAESSTIAIFHARIFETRMTF